MKQTSKLTRRQREFLRKKKIDYDDCRVVEDTSKYIKLIKSSGEIFTVNK